MTSGLNISKHFDLGERNPCKRTEYCAVVGDMRQINVAKIFAELFKLALSSITQHINSNGVDIAFRDGNGDLHKYEVLNEDVCSYIGLKRALSIRSNLRGGKFKGLIGSHLRMTLPAKKILKNIPKLRVGFQTLPRKFHKWFKRNNPKKLFRSKIANGKSFKLLKNRVLSFLHRIGYSMVMYIGRLNSVSNNNYCYFKQVKLGTVSNNVIRRQEQVDSGGEEGKVRRHYDDVMFSSVAVRVLNAYFGLDRRRQHKRQHGEQRFRQCRQQQTVRYGSADYG